MHMFILCIYSCKEVFPAAFSTSFTVSWFFIWYPWFFFSYRWLCGDSMRLSCECFIGVGMNCDILDTGFRRTDTYIRTLYTFFFLVVVVVKNTENLI